MKSLGKIFLAFVVLLSGLHPAFAEESPEQVYQKWVEASKKGNLDQVLKVSSKKIRDQGKDELKTQEDRESTIAFLRTLAPQNIQVVSSEISSDKNHATLILLADKLNPLSGKMEGKKLSSGEVHFVKEEGQWKIEDQNWHQEEAAKENAPEPRK